MARIQLKIYFAIVVVLITGLIFSYYIMDFNRSFEQNIKEIEIEELYLFEPEEIFLLGGEIKEIKDKTLILEIITPAVNSFEEPKIEMKTVKIADNTEFVKAVEKSLEEIIKEQEAILEAKKGNPGMEVLLPEFFKEEKNISFIDLKTGDIIKIETEENVKGKTEFAAKKITLLIFQPRPEQN